MLGWSLLMIRVLDIPCLCGRVRGKGELPDRRCLNSHQS